MCIEHSASLRKRTLGIVLWGVVGSGMATISKFHPFINLQQVRQYSFFGSTYSESDYIL